MRGLTKPLDETPTVEKATVRVAYNSNSRVRVRACVPMLPTRCLPLLDLQRARDQGMTFAGRTPA